MICFLDYLVAIDDNGGIMSESSGTLDFTLRRTLPAGQVETEPYSIYVHVKTSGIDDEIHNSADDTDYAVVMNDNIEDETGGFYKITFAPNEDTATLGVLGTDDSEVEAQEWFKVVITSVDASGHTPTVDEEHSQAFGGIDDDEQVVSIAVDDGLISEDANTGRFVVTRGPDSSAELDVPIVFSGAAILGTDYTTDLSGGSSPYVHFAIGVNQVLFSITAIDDSVTESAESLVATLHAPGGDDLYTVNPAAAFATATITDLTPDDPNSPTGLRGIALSSSDVELAWKLPGGGSYPDGFVIQRSTDNGATFTPYQQILDPTARSADVSGLDPNTNYVFRVDAAIDDLDGNLLGDDDDIVTAGTGTKAATTSSDQWEDLDDSVTPDIASGELSYFNGGDDLPAGIYRMLYDGGAVNYDTSEDQSNPAWLAMDYYAASDGNPLNDGLTAQPYAGNQEGITTQASLEDAEHEATPTIWGGFENPGGPIGVGIYNPSPYYGGPGVTWRLQRFVPHVSLLTTTAGTTEGDDAHPAQLYFQIDDHYAGHHYDEPITVKFDLSGSATDGASAQYSAVMLIPDGNGGNTTQPVNLASGQFTIPANVYYDVEIDITANNDTVAEWTKDLNLRLKDDLPHYMVYHYVDFDGVDTNGAEPDSDGVVLLKDNDLSFSLQTGMLVANYNDTNGNGVTDYLDPASQDEDIDPDLYEMILHVPTDYAPNTRVTLSTTSDFFNVYDSQSKYNLLSDTGTITWEDPTQVPHSVWLEVKKGSTTVNDVSESLYSFDNGDDQEFDQENTAINLKIIADTDPNTEFGGEITNKTRNWIVGQVVGEHVQIDCPDIWKTSPSYQWSVPGDILLDYIRTDALGKRVPVTNDATWGTDHHVGYLQPAIQFFWEDSTVGEVDTKTVSVHVSNINGQDFTIDSKYAVATPTLSALREQGTEGFDVPLAPSGIGIYNAAGAPNGDGMLFTAAVMMPAGFTGTGHWNFLQLIQPDRSFTTQALGQAAVTAHLTNNTLWGLDTSEHYPDFVEPHYDLNNSWPTALPDITHSTVDSPDAGLATPNLTNASISDHYSMYIMFLPPGGFVRWVPLQVDNWRFNVAATKNILNTWNLDNGHGRGPGSWTVPAKSPEWTIRHSASEPFV